MCLISSILLAFSASLDSLIIGIAYGIKKIRIKLSINIIIALIVIIIVCIVSVGLYFNLSNRDNTSIIPSNTSNNTTNNTTLSSTSPTSSSSNAL